MAKKLKKVDKTSPTLFGNMFGDKYVQQNYTLIDVDYFTDEELIAAKGSTMIFDIETYPNYFLASFQCLNSDKVVTFEKYKDHNFNHRKLKWVCENFKIVGFNSRSYDLPVLCHAVDPKSTNQSLKNLSDNIICGDDPWYEVFKSWKLRRMKVDHIDLIEVAPLNGSLKVYSGRMHAKRMQDLPYGPNTNLTHEERQEVYDYCFNDLANTRLLYQKLEKQIDLRVKMSNEYGMDLRSKSDAQVAEYVIGSEIEKRTGRKPEVPYVPAGTIVKYKRPHFAQYAKSHELKDLFDAITSADFVVTPTGSIQTPPILEGLKFPIGDSEYQMGIGGLHSCEKKVCHVADEDYALYDHDVTSYYPAIILNQGLHPKHLGTGFLDVYQTIVDRRIHAKKTGDTVTNQSLKITINGSFGKFGSKYSILYSPDLLIQVTLTGQLALLLLIEMLEDQNIKVVSANTDGIVVKPRRTMIDRMYAVIKMWESYTNFETEESKYSALYSRDVNNYIAVKLNGEAKTKGCYSEPGLQKNPVSTIVNQAVVDYLTKKIPLSDTIKGCTDITKFVTVRVVKGGAVKEGVPLGKVVRWYYKKGEFGTIEYRKSGNTVPKSVGGWPIMELPDHLPLDVDHDYYIKEAESILRDIGQQEVLS